MNQEKESKVSHSIDDVKKMNIYEKLTLVQAKLQAKKDLTNGQLKSKYRTIDGILSSLKSLLIEYRLNLTFSDEVIAIGEMDFKESKKNEKLDFATKQVASIEYVDTIEVGNRFYIKSNLILVNIDSMEQTITANGLSREAQIKKGVQVEMLTGSASTYARKKGLEGLFLIADNDALDPDSIIDEQANFEEKKEDQERIYQSLIEDIDKLDNLDNVQAISRRISRSYLPKIKSEMLSNKLTAKGLELKKAEAIN